MYISKSNCSVTWTQSASSFYCYHGLYGFAISLALALWFSRYYLLSYSLSGRFFFWSITWIWWCTALLELPPRAPFIFECKIYLFGLLFFSHSRLLRCVFVLCRCCCCCRHFWFVSISFYGLLVGRLAAQIVVMCLFCWFCRQQKYVSRPSRQQRPMMSIYSVCHLSAVRGPMRRKACHISASLNAHRFVRSNAKDWHPFSGRRAALSLPALCSLLAAYRCIAWGPWTFYDCTFQQ